ncbi:unnamed protein product [Rotaria sp. Silwood1]|nr:unnamed protein product [Rotaria sp. Silwood1]CAF3615802.1 unnamed protein product [Rotaria sp. Silwood1]
MATLIHKISINENSLIIDVFDRTDGNIRIEDNGRVIIHDQSVHDSAARGRCEYSSGQHRFRFKIEQLDGNKWAFFGIVSKNAAIQRQSYYTLTTYGWAGRNQVYLNGVQNIGHSENNTPTEHAILIHDYVRDSIPFGWSGRFWNETASDVIKTGRGFCNTKSSLFAALLRAVGIPCRLQFVDINTQILHGLVDPSITYELHTYTDFFNIEQQRWCHVDSYIVDTALVSAAKEKLVQENTIIGYGLHRDGQSEWNSIDNTFIQYVTNSEQNEKLERPLTIHKYGHFADIGAFYEAADQHGVQDRLSNRLFKWIFPLLIMPRNRAVENLRKR